MEVATGYQPVKILDVYAKIAGRQVYHHKGRDEYSIERDHRHLVALTAEEKIHLVGQFELEKCVLDAQKDDDAFAEGCKRDKAASLEQAQSVTRRQDDDANNRSASDAG